VVDTSRIACRFRDDVLIIVIDIAVPAGQQQQRCCSLTLGSYKDTRSNNKNNSNNIEIVNRYRNDYCRDRWLRLRLFLNDGGYPNGEEEYSGSTFYQETK
jgi:hypothetical protein